VAGLPIDVLDALRAIAAASGGLRLLVLHASRARGDAHAHSDWDFAYRADTSFDPDGLLARLADALKADRIDLVDLDRAGALLRYRAARDGVVCFENATGEFEQFWIDAVSTRCELGPVLERAYAQLLETSPRTAPERASNPPSR